MVLILSGLTFIYCLVFFLAETYSIYKQLHEWEQNDGHIRRERQDTKKNGNCESRLQKDEGHSAWDIHWALWRLPCRGALETADSYQTHCLESSSKQEVWDHTGLGSLGILFAF